MTLVQLEQSARALGTALRQVRTVEEYLKVRDGLGDDDEALQLLEKQARVQVAIQVPLVRGTVITTDVEDLSEIQKKIRQKVDGYLDVQERLRLLLRNVNGELSLMLGFDFAALAGKTGCC